MESHYKHLNAEERGVIFAEHRRSSSLREIGLLLGRHHGGIVNLSALAEKEPHTPGQAAFNSHVMSSQML